jgi:hypothetical protein
MTDRMRWHLFKYEVINPICCERQGIQSRLEHRRVLCLYLGGDGEDNGGWKDVGSEKGDSVKFLCEHGRPGEAVIKDVRHFKFYPRWNTLHDAKVEMGLVEKDKD